MARLIVISDIHSNIDALEAILNDAKPYAPFDAKLCAGDIVGYGPHPNEVISRLREENFVSVLGNHDRAVRSGQLKGFTKTAQIGIIINQIVLTPESRAYLNSLTSMPYIDQDLDLGMVHGSFDGGANGEKYDQTYTLNEVTAARAMRQMFTPAGHFKLGIVGHTHTQLFSESLINFSLPPAKAREYIFLEPERDPMRGTYKFRFEDCSGRALDNCITRSSRISLPNGDDWHPKIIVNPGAVGQSRDNELRAAYAIVDCEKNGTIVVTHRRVHYNQERTIRAMLDLNFPQKNIDRLSGT